MESVLLSNKELKALSSETRTEILKLLKERNYTLSELAAKTSMSAPTIKQHMKVLLESSLVELKDEGRKWKYYSLTEKGTDVIDSGEGKTNIFLVLASSAVVILAAGLIFSQYFMQTGTELAGVDDAKITPSQINEAAEISGDSKALAAINAGCVAIEEGYEGCEKIESPEICEENPKCKWN